MPAARGAAQCRLRRVDSLVVDVSLRRRRPALPRSSTRPSAAIPTYARPPERHAQHRLPGRGDESARTGRRHCGAHPLPRVVHLPGRVSSPSSAPSPSPGQPVRAVRRSWTTWSSPCTRSRPTACGTAAARVSSASGGTGGRSSPRSVTGARSTIRWPAAGNRGASSERGRGLWIANQVCDLVQIRTYPTGSVVRLFVSLDPASPSTAHSKSIISSDTSRIAAGQRLGFEVDHAGPGKAAHAQVLHDRLWGRYRVAMTAGRVREPGSPVPRWRSRSRSVARLPRVSASRLRRRPISQCRPPRPIPATPPVQPTPRTRRPPATRRSRRPRPTRCKPDIPDGTKPPSPPKDVVFTKDHHYYSSPWYDGAWQEMIGFGCTNAPLLLARPFLPSLQARQAPRHRHIHAVRHEGARGRQGVGGAATRRWGAAYGKHGLKIRHKKFDFVIGHARKLKVKPGQHVKKGQLVARSGKSGAPDGCHLHFEKRPAGGGYLRRSNPLKSLRRTVVRFPARLA